MRHPDTDQPLRIYGDNKFLGLAEIDPENYELVIIKLFVIPDQG